jgi:hypothetical protein
VAKPTEHLDGAIRNGARVTGLVFLSALLIFHVVMLLDEERRSSPTDGRFIYGLGLPGWVVYGAIIVFLAAWIAFIIVGWARAHRRRREAGRDDHTL